MNRLCAPWEWVGTAGRGPGHLRDAAGNNVVSAGDEELFFVGKEVAELIRLAPEMEEALRYFVGLGEGMPDEQAKAAALLACLDAVRVEST